MKKSRITVWLALLFWILPIVVFWILMGGSILLLWMIYAWYPIWACVVSYQLAAKNYFGMWKWISPVAFGLLNTSVYYLTFGISNALSLSSVSWRDWDNIIMSAIASVIGLGFGSVVKYLNK